LSVCTQRREIGLGLCTFTTLDLIKLPQLPS
jgi:hypothetical protein